ncbi:MAG: stage II sporulation protein M [Candidatus Methanofastidiosia archaeon]|jgi:stage II sporulation protein M
MQKEINWVRTILIMGLAFAFIGAHMIFSFYSLLIVDYNMITSLLVKKGIFESIMGILLLIVIARNTTFKDIKNILSDIKVYIVIIVVLLSLGIGAGIILQDTLSGFFQSIFDEISREAERIQSLPVHHQTLFIFGNNSRVAALSGILAFIPVIGLFLPVFVMTLNGAVIGMAPGIFGIPWWKFVLAILPHGVLELPALVLASAVGLNLAVASIKASLGYLFPPPAFDGRDVFLREIRPGWRSIKLFALIIPMLVAAAIIEVLVSPRIMALYGL